METYFKYQPINAHTDLNLVLLAERNTLFLPNKSILNDPTDCDPTINIPNGDDDLIYSLTNAKNSMQGNTNIINEIDDVISMINGNYDFESTEDDIFRNIIQKNPNLHGRVLLDRISKMLVGEPRVYSMSRSWDVSQMWSHYADSHRGICLEIAGIHNLPEGLIIRDVEYTTKRPHLTFNEIAKMNEVDSNTESVIDKLYFQKSVHWSYEVETRIVKFQKEHPSKNLFLSIPSGDFIEVDGISIKSIIFGQNTSPEVKQSIKSIIRYKQQTTPEYFEAYQDSGSFEIKRREISLNNPFYFTDDNILGRNIATPGLASLFIDQALLDSEQ